MKFIATVITLMLFPLTVFRGTETGPSAEAKYWQLRDRGASYDGLRYFFPIELERVRDGKKQYCFLGQSGAMVIQSTNEACVLASYSCSEIPDGDGPEEQHYVCGTAADVVPLGEEVLEFLD